MLLNLIFLESVTKYPNSSTMSNIIGQAHKLGYKNRKQPGRTTDPSNSPSITSNIHESWIKTLISQVMNYSMNRNITCEISVLIQLSWIFEVIEGELGGSVVLPGCFLFW